MFNRKESNIRTVLHKIGACRRQKRADEADKKKILMMTEQGKTDIEIVKKTGFCRSTVQRIRHNAGVRKYRDDDMGTTGWPVSASLNGILVMSIIEQLSTADIGQIKKVIVHPLEPVERVIKKLVRSRMVRSRYRKKSKSRVYVLAPRVAAMRKAFKAKHASNSAA